MERLKIIEHPCMITELADTVFRKYDQMCNLITEFEKKVYSEWVAGVDKACSFNQDLPVLIRNQDNVLTVNFDAALTTVLREVKYLNYLKREDIPESAAKLYERRDFLRNLNINLDRTVAGYNKIRSTLQHVEFPIVETQLNEIDAMLSEGETTLYWSDPNVGAFAEKVQATVQDLGERIQKTKDNVDKMDSIMAKWSKSSLYKRADNHKDASQRILDIENRAMKIKAKYTQVEADGKELTELLRQNAEFFKADVESETWHEYQNFIDERVVDGFEKCIQASLEYLLDNMANSPTNIPLFASKFELQHPDMVFNPSLEPENPSGFQSLVEYIIQDIFNMASLVGRLGNGIDREHYVVDMEESPELQMVREEILDRVETAVDGAMEYSAKFEAYSPLWLEDRTEFLNQFLTYGHILTPEEIEQAGTDPIPKSPPTIAQFKEQIDHYEDMYVQIQKLSDTEVFNCWFRVSIAPFKAALLNRVKLWSLMFKKHIVQTVESTLSNLASFIESTTEGLSNKIPEGDYDALVETMEHLLKARNMADETDKMFKPIQDYIALLKTYDQEMKDEVHQMLADLPDTWESLKKTCTLVRQEVAPLQANEVAIIRRRCNSFDVQQHEFREKFRFEIFFKWICENPYPNVFITYTIIHDKEEEMNDLSKKAGLFEVNIPEFKQLKACRKEIGLVKEVWDLATIVKSSIQSWKKTPWDGLDVEKLEMDCKRFAKEIRTMDKEVRAWDVFTGLDSTVKNMITAFRVIGELQNSAVRERHWHQLMQTCKVRFQMDESTTLDSLLKLELHNFEDDVRGIVDKAVKELGMHSLK